MLRVDLDLFADPSMYGLPADDTGNERRSSPDASSSSASQTASSSQDRESEHHEVDPGAPAVEFTDIEKAFSTCIKILMMLHMLKVAQF